MLTHFNDFWDQKLTESDILGQFLGPETDIMGERYFMVMFSVDRIIIITIIIKL